MYIRTYAYEYVPLLTRDGPMGLKAHVRPIEGPPLMGQRPISESTVSRIEPTYTCVACVTCHACKSRCIRFDSAENTVTCCADA